MKVGIILRILVLLALTPALCSATIIDFYTDGTIGDGDVYAAVNVWATSVVEMSGGTAYAVNLNNSSVFTMYDGDIRFVDLGDDTTINVYGGEVGYGGLNVSGSASANLYGGTYSYHIVAAESGAVHIYGYDFELAGSYLSGFWADGTRFDDIYLRGPGTYERVTFHIIPEPATLWLLALGGLLFRNRRK
ncbi:MAG TPA: PEP-CTERM sorting domain-containing protein [Sedimentisphaerales bacterium]|nr:PEP-CTERM sorting domain-containing protein [Sedimentisphaerales bacterium]